MIRPSRIVRHGLFVCYAERPDPRVRLFCVPYAGGGPAVFRSWAELLGDEIELHACELPGRGRRRSEPPFASIHEAIDSAAADMAPLLDRPYALFGHSMGGMVAYELARRSPGAPAPLLRLFASACPAPERFGKLQPGEAVTEEEFVEAIWKQGAAPEAFLTDPEVRSIFLPILRADLAACKRYVDGGGPPLSVPITVLVADDDLVVPEPLTEGWRARTEAGHGVERFSGGHFFIEGQRDRVVGHLRTTLLDDARCEDLAHSGIIERDDAGGPDRERRG